MNQTLFIYKDKIVFIMLAQWFSKCCPRLGAASPGNVLKVHILGPYNRQTTNNCIRTYRLEPSNLQFNKS